MRALARKLGELRHRLFGRSLTEPEPVVPRDSAVADSLPPRPDSVAALRGPGADTTARTDTAARDSVAPADSTGEMALPAGLAADTRFLRDARARGCTVIDGLGMLVNQGVIGVKYWTGLDVDPAAMRAELERIFGS